MLLQTSRPAAAQVLDQTRGLSHSAALASLRAELRVLFLPADLLPRQRSHLLRSLERL